MTVSSDALDMLAGDPVRERCHYGYGDCDRSIVARGFCMKHYSLMRRRGFLPPLYEQSRQRQQRVDAVLLGAMTAGDECVIFDQARPNNGGYAYVQLADGRKVGVHRLACGLAHGPAPEGSDAAHSCAQRRCINPKHLRWATRAENLADRRQHGTYQVGELATQSKLTNAQAAELRRRRLVDGVPLRQLAEEFGISITSACRIARRRAYPEAEL